MAVWDDVGDNGIKITPQQLRKSKSGGCLFSFFFWGRGRMSQGGGPEHRSQKLAARSPGWPLSSKTINSALFKPSQIYFLMLFFCNFPHSLHPCSSRFERFMVGRPPTQKWDWVFRLDTFPFFIFTIFCYFAGCFVFVAVMCRCRFRCRTCEPIRTGLREMYLCIYKCASEYPYLARCCAWIVGLFTMPFKLCTISMASREWDVAGVKIALR